MADVDVKIKNLPADPSVALTNLIAESNSMTTYKLTFQQLLTLFQASGMILKNTEVTTTSATMVTNQSYIANNASLVQLTLPSSSNVGDVLEINGKGAGGWKIIQGVGQGIFIGSSASTAGTGGSVASGASKASVRLKCTVANTTWSSIGLPQGTLTII